MIWKTSTALVLHGEEKGNIGRERMKESLQRFGNLRGKSDGRRINSKMTLVSEKMRKNGKKKECGKRMGIKKKFDLILRLGE